MKNNYTFRMQSRTFLRCLTLSGLLAVSCTDFLDVPTTSDVLIPATTADYKDMLYPFYLEYSAQPILPLMGDDVYWSKNFYDIEATDETFRRAYLWKEEIYNLSYNETHWNNQYNMIYIYNKIIDEVNSVLGESKEIEAEARVYRAMNYFFLVSTFAKPYAMATETDPGIPVIDKNDIEAKNRPRTPIREVYEFILTDLKEAIKNLPDFVLINSRYQASKIGALGLRARVFFNMSQYDKALTELEELLDILDHKVAPNGYVYELFNYDNASFDFGMWDMPSEYAQESNVEAIMVNGYMRDPTKGYVFGGMNAVLVPDHILALFEPGDNRKKIMLSSAGRSSDEPDKILKESSYSNTAVCIPDVYLMAAECYVRNNNNTKALYYLNELRKNRITAESYTELSSSDANQILRWVLEERIREFIATGYRWLDMRRLWDDPIGSTLIHKTRTLNGASYTLTKERLTVRIPEYIMQFHPDWIQNP